MFTRDQRLARTSRKTIKRLENQLSNLKEGSSLYITLQTELEKEYAFARKLKEKALARPRREWYIEGPAEAAHRRMKEMQKVRAERNEPWGTTTTTLISNVLSPDTLKTWLAELDDTDIEGLKLRCRKGFTAYIDVIEALSKAGVWSKPKEKDSV